MASATAANRSKCLLNIEVQKMIDLCNMPLPLFGQTFEEHQYEHRDRLDPWYWPLVELGWKLGYYAHRLEE